MEAGEYTEQVTLQRHDAPTDAWLTLETDPVVWARPEALGDERYFFRLRVKPELYGFRDTLPAMRVLWRDRTLEVEDVAETEQRGEMRITAKGIHIVVPDLASTARQTWKRWP
jgi:hypothetical protein